MDVDVRSSFAPQAGIKKDATGKLVIEKSEVDKAAKIDGEQLLKDIEKREEIEAKKAAEPKPESPKPVPKKTTVASTPAKPGHSRVISNADKIKEKQAALEQEKQDRKLRQSGVAKPAMRNSIAGSKLNQSINSTAKSTLNQSLNANKTAVKSNLNSTLRGSSAKEKAEEPKGLSRQNSSSRLGGVTAREPTTPGLKREGSSSRLGLAERPGTSTGIRSGSRTGTSNLRSGGRDGAATARGASTEKGNINSTLAKKVGEKVSTTLNSTLRNNRTPGRTAPGAAEPKTAVAAKGLVGRTSTASSKAATPLDYKKIEAQLIERTKEIENKNEEIVCLKEEVQNLSDRINEINNDHNDQMTKVRD